MEVNQEAESLDDIFKRSLAESLEAAIEREGGVCDAELEVLTRSVEDLLGVIARYQAVVGKPFAGIAVTAVARALVATSDEGLRRKLETPSVGELGN